MVDTGLVIPAQDRSGLSFNSAASLRKAISAAVAQTVPEGRTGAAVAVVDADGSLHVVLASKIGANWEIAGSLDKDGKHVSGSVRIAGSWGGD